MTLPVSPRKTFTASLLATLLASLLALPLLAQEARVPLTDLGIGTYAGYTGGLYPGGTNRLPEQHLAAGREALARILPRNASGAIDTVGGRIVLLSIGMSNATQEFSAFKALADADTSKSSRVIIVDGAQGGQTAAIIADDSAQFWRVVDQRLEQAGVTRAQVQVAWIKEANARPTGSFPGHADTLSNQLGVIARILRTRFTNIVAAYLSSRTYGGYATTTLNPEPYAYESGFAVKWLVERQIAGDTALEFEGPDARLPWLAWGPYLWADSLNPRGDGLTWERSDFVADGTHPSTSGRAKVAQMLLSFFTTDTLARSWYLRRPWEPVVVRPPAAPRLIGPADSIVVEAGPIDFTWQAPAGPIDAYNIEIVGPNGYRLSDSTVTSTSFRWDASTRSGVHRWRVRARNAGGWGLSSAPRFIIVQGVSAVRDAILPETMDLW